MIAPSAEPKKLGARTAVVFDFRGKPARASAAPAEVIETTSPTPDDERSAIKQAIIAWLDQA